MYSLNQHYLRFAGIIITLLTLFACTPNKLDIGDGGFISGEPCSPPCFWNITPGISTRAQTITELHDLDILQNCNYFDNSAESGNRGIACSPVAIFVFKKDDSEIIESIGFKPTQEITVDDVFKQYGEPDAVLVVAQGLPESESHTSMMLLYDSLNMSLVLSGQESPFYELDLNIQVVNISYSDDQTYETNKKPSSTWQGLGIYEPLIP